MLQKGMCTGKTWVLSLKLTPSGSRNQELSIFGKPTVRPTAADKLKWFWSSPHKRNFRYSNSKIFFPFISAVRIRKTKERKDLSKESNAAILLLGCSVSLQKQLAIIQEQPRFGTQQGGEHVHCYGSSRGRSWASPCQGSCSAAFSIW